MSSIKHYYFIILFILYGCDSKQYNEFNKVEQKINSNYTKNKDRVNSEITSTKHVFNFAKSYHPENIARLDSIPVGIVKSLKNLRSTDNAAHELYVTLIFLRLYAAHLECCHQGYIIANRSKDDFNQSKLSMVNEFAYMFGYLNSDSLPEFWSSGIIHKWIKENPHLLRDQDIKREVDGIDVVVENIAKGIYWNI